MTFEQPEALFLALLLPLLIWLRHFRRARAATITFAFAHVGSGRFKPPITWQAVLHVMLDLVFWLSLVFMILALAAPAQVERQKVYLNRGIDIMVVLDDSLSMAAQVESGISRFEQARKTIKNFIAKRENDPLGLVSFGTEASLALPPSLDYEAFSYALDDLEIMRHGDGTAIGIGLTLAAVHLQKSLAKRKVVILVTDGENNTGEISPEIATELLRSLGIVVHTIGVGDSRAVPLEYRDPQTGRQLRGIYQGTLNQDLLQTIAISTGGQFFMAGNSGSLETAFETIDSLERVETRIRIHVVSSSLVHFFVLIALALLLVDLVLRRLIIKELS